MRSALLSIIAAITFVACSSDSSNEEPKVTLDEVKINWIDTMSWLVGTWENRAEGGVMTEEWTWLNDSTLNGLVTGTAFNPSYPDSARVDTLEVVTIEQQFGALFYIPAVRDQNQGLPIKFRFTGLVDSTYIFENPEHNFPTKISYQRIGSDSVLAKVSGIWQGKQTEEQFPLKRVNP